MGQEELGSSRGRWKAVVTVVAVLFVMVSSCWTGFYLGFWAHSKVSPALSEAPGEPAQAEVQEWTCAMHPQIRQPKPGQCPICGMALIPVTGTGEVGSLREYPTTEAAKALMDIETSPVERRFVTAVVRLVGKVDYDETRLAYITAWVPGRLDRLYADYTGMEVERGQHMVYLYSPELLVAQDELRRSARALADLPPAASDTLRRSAEAAREAAREKLRRWGLAQQQIDDAEKRGVTSDHITIYAPISGTVIQREGFEGMYVEQGTRIYSIAELSTVWVKMDAYEADLPWVRFGQTVAFTTEAYPGQEFEGKISFIDPVVNPMTRTAKVRVVVPNPEGKLKPQMFVRAVVRSQVATGGRVMDEAMAGKWICPMHGEIVKPEKGNCDVCGMPLVPAEEMGYLAGEATEEDMPLVVPASAPLITGTRAIVYVEVQEADQPTFEGREIVLGPRAGDYYLVRAGLSEGEQVVTRGNFKIDADLQLKAKPSMMTPSGGVGGAGAHAHAAPEQKPAAGQPAPPVELSTSTVAQLTALYEAHAALSQAAQAGAEAEIKEALDALGQALTEVDESQLVGHAGMVWKEYGMRLNNDLVEAQEATDPENLRRILEGLETNLSELRQQLGLTIHPTEPVAVPGGQQAPSQHAGHAGHSEGSSHE